jgi:hypothetical protein
MRSGVDSARARAGVPRSARRISGQIIASDEDLVANIGEIEKLMKKPAAAADSAEGRARVQIVNRHILEILYAGAISNLAPVKRNGVVYRSDDQGKTWKRMTEYKMPVPGAQGRGDADLADELDAAAAQSDSILEYESPAADLQPPLANRL